MQCHYRPHSEFAEAISKEISQSAICSQKNSYILHLQKCAQLLIYTHNPEMNTANAAQIAAWGEVS